MKNFTKEYRNPIELINKFWKEASTKDIIYNPNMKKGDYNITRESGHDGTLLFTIQLLQRVLFNIINGKSFYKKTEPKDWSKIKKYSI